MNSYWFKQLYDHLAKHSSAEDIFTGCTSADLLNSLLAGLQAILNSLLAGLQAILNSLLAGLQAILHSLFAGLQAILNSLLAGLQAILNSLLAGLQAILNSLLAALQAIFRKIKKMKYYEQYFIHCRLMSHYLRVLQRSQNQRAFKCSADQPLYTST
jgi:hypothetical protein